MVSKKSIVQVEVHQRDELALRRLEKKEEKKATRRVKSQCRWKCARSFFFILRTQFFLYSPKFFLYSSKNKKAGLGRRRA